MLTASDKLIRATARQAFWQNYETWGSFFEGLYIDIPSDSDQENFPFLGYAPKMQEMGGSTKVKPVPEFDYTIKNKKWSAGVPIEYKLRRFCRLNAVASMIGNLGEKARRFNQYLLSQLIKTNGNCYDGVAFFGDAHIDPGGAYTTGQDNNLTHTTTNRLDPTDIEFSDAAGEMIDAMYGFVDNEGDPVMPGPNAQLILMVPTNYKRIAERIEKTDQITGPVGNDLKGTYKTVVNPFLDKATSTSGSIYLFLTNGVRKPFIQQTADPLQIEDDLEITTKDAQFTAFQFGNVGYGDWRYAVKMTLQA